MGVPKHLVLDWKNNMSYMNEQLIRDANGLQDEVRRINKALSKKEFSREDYSKVNHKLIDLKTRISEFSGNFSANSKQIVDAEGLKLVKGLNDACFAIEKQLEVHFNPEDHY